MRWTSAVSDAPALPDAVAAAARQIRDDLAGEPADLLVAFVTHHHSRQLPGLPSLLQRSLPYHTLLGCSAGGVIGGGREVEMRAGLALTAARLPGVGIHPITLSAPNLPDGDASPRAWHAALGVPPSPTPHFILLADPFSFPAGELLTGLDYAYPASVKIGGLASGAREPGGNALYLRDDVNWSGLVGVALSGNIAVEAIVAQGCRPIGRPLHITRCDGNLLLELEGRSPLLALKEIIRDLSEDDRELASHALFLGIGARGSTSEPQSGDFLIRNLVGVDPRQGALAIGDRLREGQVVRFHLRDAATSAADLATLLDRFVVGEFAQRARGALLFSCLGRGVQLYGRPGHDTEALRQRLNNLPVGGFFCNGEIGPVGGVTYLHGYTSAFGLFGPAPDGRHETAR